MNRSLLHIVLHVIDTHGHHSIPCTVVDAGRSALGKSRIPTIDSAIDTVLLPNKACYLFLLLEPFFRC